MVQRYLILRRHSAAAYLSNESRQRNPYIITLILQPKLHPLTHDQTQRLSLVFSLVFSLSDNSLSAYLCRLHITIQDITVLSCNIADEPIWQMSQVYIYLESIYRYI